MSGFLLDAHLITQYRGRDVEAIANVLSEGIGVAGGVEQDDVAADFTFQFRRSAQSDEVTFVHDGETVATLGFFHEVRGDQHAHVLFVAEDCQVLPEIAAGAGVEAGRGFVEKEDSGMMQEALRQFNAALHASGECFDAFFGAVGKADAGEDLFHALFQR